MTNKSDLTANGSPDDLPQPYRAAVEAILAEPVPEIDLQRLIRFPRTIPQRSAGAFSSVSLFGANLMTPRNLAAVAAAVAVIVVVSLWIPSSSNSNFAFAQVQQRVEKVKSVQYTEVRHDKMTDGKNAPTMTSRVMVVGSQERKDVMIKAGDSLEEGHFWGQQPGHYVDVFDAKAGKMITLYPEKKAYQVVREIHGINDKGKIETQKIMPMPKIDFYETIRAMPANPVKQLPEQAIDGKRAIGFVFEQTHQSSRGVDTWHRTYWIDPTTKLPIRIEVTCSNPSNGDSEWVKSGFVFDAEIDESLFSTDPPADYTDLTSPQPPKAEGQPGKHAEHN